jgi:glycerophosphoryl diester phosphodiesterase
MRILIQFLYVIFFLSSDISWALDRFDLNQFKNGYYWLKSEDKKVYDLAYIYVNEYFSKAYNKSWWGLSGSLGVKGKIFSEIKNNSNQVEHFFRIKNGEKLKFTLSEPNQFILIEENKSTSINSVYLGQTIEDVENKFKISDNQNKKTRIISHRGAAYIETINEEGIYPSNTLPSLQAAVQSGFDGVELDVQLSKDGEFIVSHDNNLEVSTLNCKGRITESQSYQLHKCIVGYSGMLPEKSWARDKSKLNAKLTGLNEVLNSVFLDSRLKSLIIDVKPNLTDKIVAAINKTIEQIDENKRSKLIFLVTTNEITLRVKPRGSKIALEGKSGWEPLDKVAQFTNGPNNVVSVNLGLGLGLNGGLGVKLANIVSAFPNMVYNRDVDIAYLSWSRSNLTKLKTLVASAESKNLDVVGWTLNTKDKLKKILVEFPEIDFLLTDLPYSDVAGLNIELFYLNYWNWKKNEQYKLQ